VLGGRLVRSQTNFAATFAVNAYPKLLWKKGLKPEREWLTVRDTPAGRVLLDLDIDPHPFQFRFARGMTACFDLPDAGWASPAWYCRRTEPMSLDDPKVLFVGAGVIGGSVAAWLAPFHRETYVLDRPDVAESIRKNGITTYPGGAKDRKETARPRVVDSLSDATDADVVVLRSRTTAWTASPGASREAMGDRPVVIGMQNGIANQRVLPKYFSKAIYCVVSYNAWMDSPGVIGYQKKGPLHLGTLKGELPAELKRVTEIFNLGVPTEATDRIQDAIHSKIVLT